MVGGWANPLQTLPQGLVLTFDFDFDPDPELDNNNKVIGLVNIVSEEKLFKVVLFLQMQR